MTASWNLRAVDQDSADRLAQELGVHPVTARCLVGRGIDDATSARSYLEPRLDELRVPHGLAGLDGAVGRLVTAVTSGERVGVFGDYDADGVTTTALITSFLRKIGVDCVPRVARRSAGYGFGAADAAYFAERECTLIVTGDCGTSDLSTLEWCNTRSVDVIVIDHHTVPDPDPDRPHPAFALVNPYRADSTFPFQGLASVGLGFYVMATLRTRLKRAGHLEGRRDPDLRELLDLVAVGTIADLVPLTRENRILTHRGLQQLALRTRPGFDALLKIAGVANCDIGERAVGWKLAPRINAPGRLGDATPALELLLAETPEEAERAAEVLERSNTDRRTEQDRALEEVMAALGDSDPGPAVVVAGRGWSPGVVGIVAARLVDQYNRPAFVIAVDADTGEGRGSARSARGVHLYEALAQCSEHLVRFGGHAAAAGLTIDENSIELFKAQIHRVVAERSSDVTAAVDVDAEIDVHDVSERLTAELAQLAPFGKGNAEPTLVSRGVKVRDSRRVGDGSHLKLQLEAKGRALSAIAFGFGAADPGVGALVDLAYAPAISTWGGRRRLELNVRGLQPTPSL